jgi:hypothetical protein
MVYTAVLEAVAARLVGSSPTLRTKYGSRPDGRGHCLENSWGL